MEKCENNHDTKVCSMINLNEFAVIVISKRGYPWGANSASARSTVPRKWQYYWGNTLLRIRNNIGKVVRKFTPEEKFFFLQPCVRALGYPNIRMWSFVRFWIAVWQGHYSENYVFLQKYHLYTSIVLCTDLCACEYIIICLPSFNNAYIKVLAALQGENFIGNGVHFVLPVSGKQTP